MARFCGKCNIEIKDLEPVRCSLCEAYFHVRQECSDVTRSNMQQMFSIGKALWLCLDCREVLGKRTLRSFMEEKQKESGDEALPQQDNETAALRKQVAELTGLVSTLQKEVISINKAVLKKLDGIKTSPGTKENDTDNQLGRKRRRRDHQDDSVAATAAQLPKSCGTSNFDLSSLSLSCSIVNITPPDDRFYVYLGGLNPKICDDDIVKIIQFCRRPRPI